MSNRARNIGGGSSDNFANVIYDAVTESGANTLTFEEINVGLNIFDKVGMVIHLIEYSNHINLLQADDDSITFGLTQSNGWTTVDPSESSIITYEDFSIAGFGTAANALQRQTPYVRDFSTLPGGGILVTPKPLYLFAKGTNLGSAATVKVRIYFTIMKLKPEEYFELLEARQYFG